MTPGRKKWTGAEEGLLRRLSDSGKTPRETAELLERTESSVCNRLDTLGISRRGHGRGRWMAWSEADIALLTRLHGEGALFGEIAERLGRGMTAVASKARAIGLCRNAPPVKPAPGPQEDNEGAALDFTDGDPPAEAPKRPQRDFSEIEQRRVRQFLARGDTHADIARQLRCDVEDIRPIAGSAERVPLGEDCGGAGVRQRQPTTTTAAPRYNFFREGIF